MILDPRHLKFTNPVRIRVGGHVGLIRTVEDAIDWIDNQTDKKIRRALMVAKEKLHEANDDRTVVLADEAREILATGLDSVNLLHK